MAKEGFANTVQLGGRTWVVGGQWSAPNYAVKPKRLSELVREELHDPDATLAAYFKNEAQMAWFVFENPSERPGKTPVLSQALITQLDRFAGQPGYEFPMTVFLNLGPFYWLVIFDSNRNVLPGYELWGSAEYINAILENPDNAGRLSAFRETVIEYGDEDEALSWLFRDLDRRLIYAEPIKTGGLPLGLLAGLGALVVVGVVADHYVMAEIHARQEAKAEEAARQALMHEMLQQQQMLAAEKLADTQFNQRLTAYWQNYPRPWVGTPPINETLSKCQSMVDGQEPDVDGWIQTDEACSFIASEVDLTVNWKRGLGATIFALPESASFDPTGETATSQSQVMLEDTATSAGTSPDLGDQMGLLRNWIGTSQEFGAEISVKVAPFTPFSPPVPGFVPASKVKEVQAETPVIWHQADVSITSNMPPWSGWPLLDSPGFVIQNLTASITGAGTTWTLNGEQYAR
jgi:hypothetical protein